MPGQEVIEDTGHFVLLVVDDEWDGQSLAPIFDVVFTFIVLGHPCAGSSRLGRRRETSSVRKMLISAGTCPTMAVEQCMSSFGVRPCSLDESTTAGSCSLDMLSSASG